ncbi:MAG TPA: O-antigen ligase family protein [Anaerolineales bacterium]|nr:O-antigen ligase family protein [Anaerolineales bacterium]
MEKTVNLSGRVRRVLWAAFLVSLPVTSFPFFPAVLGGKSTVRPLAIYPLIGLFILVMPRLFKIRLPRAFIPLFVFAIAALISGGVAMSLGIPVFNGITVLDRVIRNFMTLAIGIGFYLLVALIPEDQEELRFTLRWLFIGFAVALLWGSLQAVYVVLPNSPTMRAFFDQLNELHHLISTRNLQRRRVSGMAYEPSWFAEQLCILLLPWLLTSVFRRHSVFPWRFRGVQGEDLMLVWAVGVLILTYSRGGVVILFALLGLSFMGWRAKKRMGAPRSWVSLLKRASLAGGVMVVLGTLIFVLGSQNQYFSRLWRFWTEDEGGRNYWAYIAFGQRFIYWEAALDIFEQHPVFGVGMGNYALVFEDALPEVPLYRYPEILRLIVPEKGREVLLTPKNLFVRVLSETGLVGFAFFVGFLWVVLGEGMSLWLSDDKEQGFWGRAGVLGFVAACLVGFSTDSFATPNMWVLFGLVTAASRIFSDYGPVAEGQASVSGNGVRTRISPVEG